MQIFELRETSHYLMNKAYKDTNLLSIYLITLMAILGLSSTSPAFPNLSESFDVGVKDIGYILTLFTLPGVILAPLLGFLADKFGRKLIIVPALFLFGIAGGLVGFAQTIEQLLILNFLQGVGAAPLGALNVTLISDSYSGNKLTKYMGLNNSVLNVGTALFPLAGGFLASMSWRYPFMMAFLGVPIAIFVLVKLKDKNVKRTISSKDYLKLTFDSIKDKNLIVLNLISFITFVFLFGPFLNYLPFLINEKFQAEANEIGIIFFIMSITSALFSFLLDKLVKITTEKKLLLVSFSVYAISMLLMILAENIFLIYLSVLLYGLAQGINIPNVLSIIAKVAKPENVAFVFSFNRTIALLGQAVAPLFFGGIFDYLGVDYVFFVSVGISFLMFVFVKFFILEKDGEKRNGAKNYQRSQV